MCLAFSGFVEFVVVVVVVVVLGIFFNTSLVQEPLPPDFCEA
jgi:hypothetical protein